MPQLSQISSKSGSHMVQIMRNQNSLVLLLMEIFVSINKEETKLPSIFARETIKLTVIHHGCIHNVNEARNNQFCT